MEEYETGSKTKKELDPEIEQSAKNITSENVLTAMVQKSRQMNKVLQQAWSTRPENEPELEDQLLSILAAGQKLEREIKNIIEHQKQEPDLK